jgi:hypothetical protein
MVYNPDGAVNQGEFSNHCTLRKAQTYIDAWDRIKRNPRTVGALNESARALTGTSSTASACS